MKPSDHIIKSQIFEIGFFLEEKSLEFQKELSDLIRNELAEITDRCLSRFDRQTLSVINRLEVDLGDIPYTKYLKSLPVIYEEELLKQLIIKMDVGPDSEQQEGSIDSMLQMIRHFLVKGYMPWNYNETRWTTFDEIFVQSLKTNKEVFIKEVDSLLKSGVARTRLIRQLEDKTIHLLVKEVEPSQADTIIQYHHDWMATQKHTDVIKAGDNELAKSLWEFIFNYLYEERGSYFNTRAFLSSTLHQISSHYNVSFQTILSLLNESYQQFAPNGLKGELSMLLYEIWRDHQVLDKEGEDSIRKDKPEVNLKYTAGDLLHFLEADEWTVESGIPSRYSLDQVVAHSLSTRPKVLMQLLLLLVNSPSKLHSFLKPLDERSIHGLISLLQPTNDRQIIQYHQLIVDAQDEQEIVHHSREDFPKTIWSLIMVILIENHGGSFNHKVFIKKLVTNTAKHFGVSYESLLTSLFQAMELLAGSGSFTVAFQLVEQIYKEDVKGIENIRERIDIKAFDPEWLVESVCSGKVHPVLQNEGILSVEDLILFMAKEDTSYFAQFMRRSMQRVSFSQSIAKALSSEVCSKMINQMPFSGHQSWSDTFRSLDNIAKSDLINGRTIRVLLKELMLHFAFGLTSSSPKDAESALIGLSGRYGVDFNQLVRAIHELADASGNAILARHAQLMMDKYRIALSDESPNALEPESKTSASDEALVEMILCGINGIIDRKRIYALGFKTVDDILLNVLRRNPQLLKTKLTVLGRGDHSFFGIGRDISLSTYYSLLTVLNPEYGRQMTQLLRILELQLNTGLAPINRFLSASRSLVIAHLSQGDFSLDKFLEEFSNLVSSTAPHIYIQIIPVLSKKISSISLPTKGAVNDVIHHIEKQLGFPEDQSPTLDTANLKRIIANDFFQKGLDKESTIRPYFEETADVVYDEIYIENAGLVIANSYLPILLERCEYMAAGVFKSTEYQARSALLIQHLLMDHPPLDEHHLPLNKVLCGLPIDRPITTDIKVESEHHRLIHGLIEAITGHWTIIGSSSIEGFRGSWLWRKGKLEHKEDCWELLVEQNSYDMLLDHLPFTISPIKYSWMPKPLIVNWR
ncbi:contractile injection system tape measure protein [Marinoscillum sp.]|uniref:contractile injection system tape measure protein n=1 Tax=Marinoscillum sp. TaxID=2024838 RepID=UPI003BACE9CB